MVAWIRSMIRSSVSNHLRSLQNEGPKAKLISCFAAVKNLILGQTIAVGISVAFADAAVEAVVFAVIGKFN